ADGAVRLYATSNGTLLDTIRHSQTITSIAFDPNGQRMLTGSRDQTARLWQLHRDETNVTPSTIDVREIGILIGHTGAVKRVVFDPTGQLAATATDQPDSAIRIFDVGIGRPPTSAPIHRYEVGRAVGRIAFSQDSRRMLAIAG